MLESLSTNERPEISMVDLSEKTSAREAVATKNQSVSSSW